MIDLKLKSKLGSSKWFEIKTTIWKEPILNHDFKIVWFQVLPNTEYCTRMCAVCRRSASCSSKRLIVPSLPRRWNSESSISLTASLTRCSLTRLEVSLSGTSSSSRPRWHSSSVSSFYVIFCNLRCCSYSVSLNLIYRYRINTVSGHLPPQTPVPPEHGVCPMHFDSLQYMSV